MKSRTPMNSIVGFSSLLNSELSKKDMATYCEMIKKNSDSLLVLIDDILDISKIQSQQMEINIKPVDIIPILYELEASCRFQSDEKGLELICHTGQYASLTCIADPVRLKQILRNLIDNAIKYTTKGSV